MSFLRELTAYVDNNYRAAGNRTAPPEKGSWGCAIASILLLMAVGGCTALWVERWI